MDTQLDVEREGRKGERVSDDATGGSGRRGGERVCVFIGGDSDPTRAEPSRGDPSVGRDREERDFSFSMWSPRGKAARKKKRKGREERGVEGEGPHPDPGVGRGETVRNAGGARRADPPGVADRGARNVSVRKGKGSGLDLARGQGGRERVGGELGRKRAGWSVRLGRRRAGSATDGGPARVPVGRKTKEGPTRRGEFAVHHALFLAPPPLQRCVELAYVPGLDLDTSGVERSGREWGPLTGVPVSRFPLPTFCVGHICCYLFIYFSL